MNKDQRKLENLAFPQEAINGTNADYLGLMYPLECLIGNFNILQDFGIEISPGELSVTNVKEGYLLVLSGAFHNALPV